VNTTVTKPTPPTITVKSMIFSDGTKIELEPSDVVVFVGPNNAGKSRVLTDIQGAFHNHTGKVSPNIEITRTGSPSELEAYLASEARIMVDGSGMRTYRGLNYSISQQGLASTFQHHPGNFLAFFCTDIGTGNRLQGANSVEGFAPYTDVPSHPMHVVFSEDEIANRVCSYFRRAFDKDLFPLYAGGHRCTLLVGDKPPLQPGEDRISTTYVKRVIAATSRIEDQGDGMRAFATVLLWLLTTRSQSIVVLDEPEAFLHPPQARLLGEIIAKERPQQSQLFVSTHSSDILQGLMNAATNNMRIIRLQREGNINKARELSKAKLKKIATDPLMQYSGVLTAIFHERAFITEADADCMFYNCILTLPSIHGARQPDAMFIHGGGKDRIHALAQALRAVDVKTDVIVDIDILRGDDGLERLAKAVGVDWLSIQSDAKALRTAIDGRKAQLSSADVILEVGKILSALPKTGPLPDAERKQIENILKQTSPWAPVKEGGKAALPKGQPTQQFNTIDNICSQSGLWIVPVGEMEGFCKSVGGHGPPWVQSVLETKDLGSDPELQQAREFVAKIWNRA
jgi:energy-coupling factor transporter ATP-binding protein EcfA2